MAKGMTPSLMTSHQLHKHPEVGEKWDTGPHDTLILCIRLNYIRLKHLNDKQ